MPDYVTILGSGLLSAILSLLVSVSTIEYRFRRKQDIEDESEIREWYDRAEELVKEAEYAFIYSIHSERNSINRAYDELDPLIKPLHVHGHTAPDQVPGPVIHSLDHLATICDEIVGIIDPVLDFQDLDPEARREWLSERLPRGVEMDIPPIKDREEWEDVRKQIVNQAMEENINSVEEVLIEVRENRKSL